MLNKLFRQRLFKFLVGGGVAAALNLILIFCMVEWLKFNTPVLRNVANAVSIEISLLFSFLIYRIWVWPGGVWTVREVLWRQLPLYHISAGTSVITRIFLIFPLLDWLKVNYAFNSLLGILMGAALNYLISDRLVFKVRVQPLNYQREAETSSELYYPEGLEPALANSSSFKNFQSSETGRLQSISPGRIGVLSILIPAYNEENCIVPTIQSISQILEEERIAYEILVVYDKSSDRTEELLQQISSQNPKVRYINNYYPKGFGFAIRCGLENFQGDYVTIMMADSSDSPANLVNYYYKLQEGYDCVFGSRFIKGGKVIDYPTHKLLVNRLANVFIQILFGLNLNDTTNAFKIYRREVIQGIFPLISHHFNLTVEMPLKAIIRGYSYTIIPITWQNRATGVSKLKLKEMGSRYLFIVLYIWLEKHLSRGDYVRKRPQLAIQSKSR